MGGYRKRGTPRMGLSVPLAYHLALRCKSLKTKTKNQMRDFEIRLSILDNIALMDEQGKFNTDVYHKFTDTRSYVHRTSAYISSAHHLNLASHMVRL